jgi:MFS family permease
VAFVVRLFVREPERWSKVHEQAPRPRIRELFAPGMASITARGTMMAIVALIAWWSSNAFIPTIATGLAQAAAQAQSLERAATLALAESWKTTATTWFNLGGLIGTLLTIPIAKFLGRKAMFALYFAGSAAALYLVFGLPWPPETRLYLYFFIGITVFGIFGSFTFYLPELFPTRLRGTGSGFCYNIGRVAASVGPFLVGAIAARGVEHALDALAFVALVPLVGLLLVPFIIETRGRPLLD